MHRNNPVNEDRPHVLIDVTLVPHVEPVRLSELFGRLHVFLNFFAVKTHVVDVCEGRLVNLRHLGKHILLNALLECPHLRVESNLRQFVART